VARLPQTRLRGEAVTAIGCKRCGNPAADLNPRQGWLCGQCLLAEYSAVQGQPTAELYVTLRMFTPGAEWPRCYYDRSKLCGDRLLDNKPDGYKEYTPENPSWHIAGFCECPSCPVRCAIRDAMPSDTLENKSNQPGG
jgi:hypothetical protein